MSGGSDASSAAMSRGRKTGRAADSAGTTRTPSCAGNWPLRSRTWKLEPLPSSLDTEMPPECSSSVSFTRASPMPVPPKRRVPLESAWAKRSKMTDKSWVAMPTPVSMTSTWTQTSSSCRRTVTLPFSVNLSALDTRFWKTLSMRDTSTLTAVGARPSSSSATPFLSASTSKGTSSEDKKV